MVMVTSPAFHLDTVPENTATSTLEDSVGSPRMAVTCARDMPVWIFSKFSWEIFEPPHDTRLMQITIPKATARSWDNRRNAMGNLHFYFRYLDLTR